MFNSEEAICRIDCSEFMEKFSSTKLIGAPPGYVGYEEGGTLTEAVRRRPYQLVLFDEFEKAHREIANLLLQILDEGFITDSQGRKVDFRNTIIIMTSNIGAHLFSRLSEGTSAQDIADGIMVELQMKFPPEFLNRIDETIIFNKLSKEDIKNIVDIEIKDAQLRLKEKKLQLTISADAKNWLGERGYDPKYGARPLRRLIQFSILNPLAKVLLQGKVKGEATIEVVKQGEGLAFTIIQGDKSETVPVNMILPLSQRNNENTIGEDEGEEFDDRQ